jgi:hypothetical protein
MNSATTVPRHPSRDCFVAAVPCNDRGRFVGFFGFIEFVGFIELVGLTEIATSR